MRTLQKAQNLYDDVRLQLKDEYMDAFYDEIRLACYGIVVESTDGLYYRENEDTNNDPVSNVTFNLTNRLEFRIKNHYLRGVRISGNMVDIIQKYYENKAEINAEEVDCEYQIFLHAGDKANYYKSDEEPSSLNWATYFTMYNNSIIGNLFNDTTFMLELIENPEFICNGGYFIVDMQFKLSKHK